MVKYSWSTELRTEQLEMSCWYWRGRATEQVPLIITKPVITDVNGNNVCLLHQIHHLFTASLLHTCTYGTPASQNPSSAIKTLYYLSILHQGRFIKPSFMISQTTSIQNIKYICTYDYTQQFDKLHFTEQLTQIWLDWNRVLPSPSLSRSRLASRCGSNL